MKASNPAGSVTSRRHVVSELTTNVRGTPFGPYTNEPAGATLTGPSTQNVELTLEDIEPLVLAGVNVKRRSVAPWSQMRLLRRVRPWSRSTP